MRRFGLEDSENAGKFLDSLLTAIRASFDDSVTCLDVGWRETLYQRKACNLRLLSGAGPAS